MCSNVTLQISRDSTDPSLSRSLPRNQVPEWSASYINYKGLKKHIKSVVGRSKQGEALDLAGESTGKPSMRLSHGALLLTVCPPLRLFLRP